MEKWLAQRSTHSLQIVHDVRAGSGAVPSSHGPVQPPPRTGGGQGVWRDAEAGFASTHTRQQQFLQYMSTKPTPMLLSEAREGDVRALARDRVRVPRGAPREAPPTSRTTLACASSALRKTL